MSRDKRFHTGSQSSLYTLWDAVQTGDVSIILDYMRCFTILNFMAIKLF